LIVREVADEVLVYDLERHRAVCLNRAAARVWRACDGRTTVDEMARALAAEMGGDARLAEEAVRQTLERLGRDGLLREPLPARPRAARMSRRELIRAAGAAAAASLPLVVSIIAPTAAQASSCLPTGAGCSSSLQCCSGVCSGNVCA
jgi:hypothetical protein